MQNPFSFVEEAIISERVSQSHGSQVPVPRMTLTIAKASRTLVLPSLLRSARERDSPSNLRRPKIWLITATTTRTLMFPSPVTSLSRPQLPLISGRFYRPPDSKGSAHLSLCRPGLQGNEQSAPHVSWPGLTGPSRSRHAVPLRPLSAPIRPEDDRRAGLFL